MQLRELIDKPAALAAASPNAGWLLVTLALLLACEGVVAWRHWARTAASETAALNAARARAIALVTSGPLRRDSVRRVQDELVQASDSFLLAPSAAQSASAAATALRDIASDASAELGTFNVHADSVEHRGVRWVSVDGEATGSFDVLMHFVAEAESGEPFTVKHLAIAPVPNAYGGVAGMRARFTLTAAARRVFDFER